MEPPVPAVAAPTAGISCQPAISWSSSTNWKVCGGSLQDAICFESSVSVLEGGDDDGAVSISGGLLLTRPAGGESTPCEITICFREKLELHRIYVQSTARVYEIYYATEWEDKGNEYLCTVRCGATGKVVFLPRCDSGGVLNPLKDSNPSGEVSGMIKSESNTINDEDGWVEVKIPDSSLLGDRNNTFAEKRDGALGANSQIYYEATAEISDASPCTSVMLRLLSLQTKECINIEEIYIYADPIESTDSGSPRSMTGNMTGNSLLAMLVPSMMQLSKAGSSKIQDRAGSFNTSVQKHEFDASVITEETPKTATVGMERTYSSMAEKEQVSTPTVLNEINTKFVSEKEVPSPHHIPEYVPGKGNATHGHLEKVLDDLLLRVGRIEAVLSRFEENMLKPLTCIDTRLQQVEQQLDALSLRSTTSKPFQCSRISAPEFQFDDCDSDGGFGVSDVGKEDGTVDSPEVDKEDATVNNSPVMVEEDATVGGPVMVEEMPAGIAVSPAADEAGFVPVSVRCPGLFIKAPEFMNEEDEHVSSNDISESAAAPCSKARASLSIDDALTSVLKAFMLSTSTSSPENVIASVLESQSSNVAVDNPQLDDNVKKCKSSEISVTIFSEINRVDSVHMDAGSDTTLKEGGGRGMCHQQWPQVSLGELAIEEVSSTNQHYVARDDASEVDESENGSRKWIDDDSNIDEATNEVPNLTRHSKIWDEESSSDSNIDESLMESHHYKDWLDEKSTDSENESYTLHNWLYGRQDDHRFKEASSMGATNCNDTTAEVRDRSVRCNQNKSKVEIERALDSSQDGELRDIQQVLDSTMNDESSLLDVQFVQHEKSNYAVQLNALMMDMVDPETERSNWLNSIGTEQQSDSSSLESSQLGAPVAIGLLIDMEATMKNNEFSMEGSSNHHPLSSLI